MRKSMGREGPGSKRIRLPKIRLYNILVAYSHNNRLIERNRSGPENDVGRGGGWGGLCSPPFRYFSSRIIFAELRIRAPSEQARITRVFVTCHQKATITFERKLSAKAILKNRFPRIKTRVLVIKYSHHRRWSRCHSLRDSCFWIFKMPDIACTWRKVIFVWENVASGE